MKIQKKKKPKKTKLHIAVKIHTAITTLVFVAYICSGVFLGQGLLLRDLQNKYALAASSVSLSLWVVGLPEAPVLSGYEQCDNGSLTNWLNWTGSLDVTSYDVYRDDEILISGITTNYYNDTNVQQNSAYAYYIVAYGPLGNAQSNEIVVSDGICEPPPPPQPTCSIATFDGIDLSQHTGSVQTTNQTPLITGTTNMANALLSIEIYPGPVTSVSTVANGNGYWFWTVPNALPLGAYTLNVTARDPNDFARVSTVSLIFEIIEKKIESEEDDEEGHGHKSEDIQQSTTQGRPVPPLSRERRQKNVSVEVLNKDRVVFRAQELYLNILLKSMGEVGKEHAGWFTYRILDPKSNVLYEMREEQKFFSEDNVTKNIKLPVSIGPGKYKISLAVLDGDKAIGAENFFYVQDFPFIDVGGGILLTNETFVANLGWILLILLLILLIFLILLWIEHRLYTHADRNVFDIDMKKEGLISKRKGVGT